MNTIRIGNTAATHLYSVGVKKNGQRLTIEIDANNRTQAASIAVKAGYEVCDMNMVG